MYKHLFVPVDGSELSHRAMEGSIALAKQLGARITGFVVEPDLPINTMSGDAAASAERIKTHEAKNQAHSSALLGQFEQAVFILDSGKDVVLQAAGRAVKPDVRRHIGLELGGE